MAFLMASQKAMLHRILEENQFSPSDFEIDPSTAQRSNENGDAVRLKDTNHYFAIYRNETPDYVSGKFFVEYSPGKEEIWELQFCTNWNDVCYTFVQYLSFLQREITTSDPWQDADRFSHTLKSLPQTADPNTPVDELERKAIWKALGTIQATFLEYVRGSDEKAAFVEQHFEALHDAATKFGRKDYLMLLYTTIIGVATAMGVPSHMWAGLLQPLTQAVGH